jgi:hypothetical protein
VNKEDLKALTKGQLVKVKGNQDGKRFSNEPGVVTDRNDNYVTVRFDEWTEGHGTGGREWNFFVEDVADYNIIPQKPKADKKRPRGPQEYRGNGKHEWEDVTDGTRRLRVPGGWLYVYDESGVSAPTMGFVPTPEVVGYVI